MAWLLLCQSLHFFRFLLQLRHPCLPLFLFKAASGALAKEEGDRAEAVGLAWLEMESTLAEVDGEAGT